MVKLYVVQMTKSKIRFAFPFFVLLVLLPLILWTVVAASGHSDEMQAAEIIRQLHVWIPLLSGWWTIVFASDFFSSGGNELMYLLHKTAFVLVGQLAGMFSYLLLVFLVFYLYHAMFPLEDAILSQLLTESAMVCSLTFFFCFLFQNTGAALMVIAVYCIYLNLFDTLRMFQFLSVFPQDVQLVERGSGMAAKPLACSFVFLAGGMLLFRVRRVYK